VIILRMMTVQVVTASIFDQNPSVFAAAALRAVDDHRAAAERDAGQAAGKHINVFAGAQNERPQVDVSSF
jgi:hypothetical protein